MESSIVTQLSDAVKTKLNKILSLSNPNSPSSAKIYDPIPIELLADAIRSTLIKILPRKNNVPEEENKSSLDIKNEKTLIPIQKKGTENINVLSEEIRTNLQNLFLKKQKPIEDITRIHKDNVDINLLSEEINANLKKILWKIKKPDKTQRVSLISDKIKTNLQQLLSGTNVERIKHKDSLLKDNPGPVAVSSIDPTTLEVQSPQNTTISDQTNILSLSDEIKSNLKKSISVKNKVSLNDDTQGSSGDSSLQSPQNTNKSVQITPNISSSRNIILLSDVLKKNLEKLFTGTNSQRIKKKVSSIPGIEKEEESPENVIIQSSVNLEKSPDPIPNVITQSNVNLEKSPDPIPNVITQSNVNLEKSPDASLNVNEDSSLKPPSNVILKTKPKSSSKNTSTGVFMVINSTLNEPTNIDYKFPG